MSPEIIGVIGLVVMVALMFARMWIGAAMALVGFIGYAIIMGIKPAFVVVSIIPFTTMATYMMTTVPLYIFMGMVLFQSGVGKDLYDTAFTLVGQCGEGWLWLPLLPAPFSPLSPASVPRR